MKTSVFIYIIIVFSFVNLLSCSGRMERNKYNGYEKVFSSDQIKPIVALKGDSVVHVSIPKEDSMIFKYNSQLEDISFVKLETTKQSKLNTIDKIIISKDRIIIVDKILKREVYIFDGTGKFITSISGQGKIYEGQVHIRNFLDVTYDFGTEEIILHDQSTAKLYYFDKNGKFKYTQKEYFYFVQFANIPGTEEYIYINPLGANQHLPTLKGSNLYFGQRDTKVQTVATADAIKDMKTDVTYIINSHNSITNSNQRMFFVPEFSNRVYRIFGKRGVREELYIDLPSPNTFEKLKNSDNQTIGDFTRLKNTAQYYCFNGDVLCNEQDIYFIPTYRAGTSGYFYSKSKKRIIAGGNLSNAIEGDTAKLAGYQYPISVYGDYFVSLLYPADLKLKFGKADKRLSAIQSLSKPEDNPVILFYKIKD